LKAMAGSLKWWDHACLAIPLILRH